MAAREELTEQVRRRARSIADSAFARGRSTQAGARVAAPAWLKAAVGVLPEGARDALRDALGPDVEVERARAVLSELRRERQALRNREAALETARDDLDQSRRNMDTARAEAAAERRAAERDRAAAERTTAEAMVIRRVPLGQIEWSPEASPRPLVGVARLAANIERFGQLSPLVVRPGRRAGHYALVTGYRRMAALARARCPHVDVRVLPALDDATAAALYVAENCLVGGVSPNAVRDLADRVGDRPGFAAILPLVLADDEATVETLALDDLAAQALRDLAEGAAWVAALRPHWAELEAVDRAPIEQLITYFSKLAKRLR
jgi:hypothetical protein